MGWLKDRRARKARKKSIQDIDAEKEQLKKDLEEELEIGAKNVSRMENLNAGLEELLEDVLGKANHGKSKGAKSA